MELWVVVSCPCGQEYAYRENGYFPLCGLCGQRTASPTEREERRARGRGLLVTGVVPEIAAAEIAVRESPPSLIEALEELAPIPTPAQATEAEVRRWLDERDNRPPLKAA